MFCLFLLVSQAVIGRVDVQSKPAHFYVRMSSSFDLPNSVIFFDIALVNEGGVFDLSSGKFTAPVNGIYHFEFSGVKDSSATYLDVILQINGANWALAITSQNDQSSKDTISMNASFKLKANDVVNLLNYGNGALFEYPSYLRNTHFSGWLVSEDLAAVI